MPYPYTYPFYYDITPDFTLDDTMARIRYELSDREIYNDIRSDIGVLKTQIVVDADPTFEWKWWQRLLQTEPSQVYVKLFKSSVTSPSAWEVYDHSGTEVTSVYPAGIAVGPYYDYAISLVTSSDLRVAPVKIANTGTKPANIRYSVRYKYLATERITHEEFASDVLTVRATDEASIGKYGRRVMNLVWTEGTDETTMQSLVDRYLDRYKEPLPKVSALIKGINDTLITQIHTRDMSDVITVVCGELGLSEVFFLDTISIRDSRLGIPECKWGLGQGRLSEKLTIFTLDTSELDSSHLLG